MKVLVSMWIQLVQKKYDFNKQSTKLTKILKPSSYRKSADWSSVDQFTKNKF